MCTEYILVCPLLGGLSCFNIIIICKTFGRYIIIIICTMDQEMRPVAMYVQVCIATQDVIIIIHMIVIVMYVANIIIIMHTYPQLHKASWML